MTVALILCAFGALLTAGVLWAAGPLLRAAPGRAADATRHAAVGIGLTIYS